MRVVLDVNVLISAAITPKGEARGILHQAETEYTLLLSDFILWQVERVLAYPHIQAHYSHLTKTDITDYLAYLQETGVLIIEQTSVTVSPDTEDNRILAAAVDGQADYLVTGNLAHFPATYGPIKIISIAAFRDLLK